MAKVSRPVEEAGGKIADTFYDWLAAEVYTSALDNPQLDDLIEARRFLALGYEDDDNWSANKQRAHLDRMDVKFWPLFEGEPNNDEFSAQVLFGAMMFVSGAYRIQCYLQSKTPQEYAARRKRAVGINLKNVVSEQLATILPASGNFSHAKISVKSPDGPSLEHCKDDVVSKVGETTVRSVCRRVEHHLDLGQERSPSVDEMIKAQKGWIEFATDCVAVAAKIRYGDLAAVPFLEPKSISARPAPKVIYPLEPGFPGYEYASYSRQG